MLDTLPEQVICWEEYDNLTFEKVKQQRKRMEHLYEIIKDLTFKLKQAKHANIKIASQFTNCQNYQSLYQSTLEENHRMTKQIQNMTSQLKYAHQNQLQLQINIENLKQEIIQQTTKQYYASTQKHKQNEGKYLGQNQSQEFLILKAQYEELLNEFNISIKQNYYQEKENQNLRERVQANMHIQEIDRNATQIGKLKSVKSHKNISCEIAGHQSEVYLNLKAKYSKIKMQLKKKNEQIGHLELSMDRNSELIELLKEQKVKVCACHLKKMQLLQKTGVGNPSKLQK